MSKVVKNKAGRPRDESVEESVYEASRAVLREGGYAAFSIEKVAAVAGVGKATVYRRWASKGDLLVDMYMADMPRHPMPSTHALAEDDFRFYLSQTVERLSSEGWALIIRSLVAEAQSNPQTLKALRERIIEPRRQEGRRLVEKAKASGEFRDDIDTEILLDLLFGSVWYRLLLTGAPIDRDFAEHVLAAVLLIAHPQSHRPSVASANTRQPTLKVK